MPKARTQLTRILARDHSVCGVHLGGCGRKLSTKSSASVDHMIPKSFIGFMPAIRSKDFYRDWNTQPMCRDCNNEDRGGQMDGWPVFRCVCHYLQIGGDEGMYIHERTGSGNRVHLLVERAVSDDGTVVMLYASRLPGSGNTVGWSRDLKIPGGHLLLPVPKNSVRAFNWFELARIGEARGRLAQVGKNGERCTFFPSGEIVPGSEHFCAQWFPVDIGHYNVSNFDPFSPMDEASSRRLEFVRSTGRGSP